MTISVWRYSHLALAVSSFLLLTLASVTGIILAFQPVSEKLQPYRAENFKEVTLAQTLPALRKAYPGITELSVDANQFVQIKGTDDQGKKLLAYVDPLTAKKLGTPEKVNEFFQWVTSFHRSLFLHEPGRFFIGLTAFLLLLITISGTILIIQRQRSFKRFFAKIARDGFAQYYHVVLGRLSLIPILIIAISGTYLSLVRFELVNTTKQSAKIDLDAIRSSPEISAADFKIFKNTKLSEVENIEFPFSEDVEDYYTIKLKDRELSVNQINGDILSESKYPTAVLLTNLSLNLHTGRASTLWAIVLAIASANILFFIYSGFAITLKRRANRTKNKYTADESEFIILVGSENGSTFGFAQAVHQQLLKAGEKSHLTELNKYTVFPKAKHLLVFTATYGLGEAPTNSIRFAKLVKEYQQINTIKYSVLGFGSHAYPDFCKFAFEVNSILSHQQWAVPLTDIHTVNDKAPDEFTLWAEAWAQQAGINIQAASLLQGFKPKKLDRFTVSAITSSEQTKGTFTVQLQGKRGLRIKSGDLLALYPANDHRERLYSIGFVENKIRLSVRLHEGGLGSGFLYNLKSGEKIRARVVNNPHFHFADQAPEVVMISNGTGIAPFLGMINQNKRKTPCHLYCGFREKSSYKMYQGLLDDSKTKGKVTTINAAFSRENEKQYVSDLIKRDGDLLAEKLRAGGVIMICGSLAMQKDVMDLFEVICQEKNKVSVSFYQSRNQIRTDCY